MHYYLMDVKNNHFAMKVSRFFKFGQSGNRHFSFEGEEG